MPTEYCSFFLFNNTHQPTNQNRRGYQLSYIVHSLLWQQPHSWYKTPAKVDLRAEDVAQLREHHLFHHRLENHRNLHLVLTVQKAAVYLSQHEARQFWNTHTNFLSLFLLSNRNGKFGAFSKKGVKQQFNSWASMSTYAFPFGHQTSETWTLNTTIILTSWERSEWKRRQIQSTLCILHKNTVSACKTTNLWTLSTNTKRTSHWRTKFVYVKITW